MHPIEATMMKRIWIAITLVCLLLASVVLFLIVRTVPSKIVKLGYVPYTSSLPAFVAVEKGYFRELGLDVQLVESKSANEAVNSVLTGAADGQVAVGTHSPLIIEAKSPGQFVITWALGESEHLYNTYLIVGRNSKIKDLAGLAGRKIGVHPGTSQVLNVTLILSSIHMSEREVNIIQLEQSSLLPALASGAIDAAFVTEPQGTVALEEDIARVLEANPRCKYIMCPFPAGLGFFSRDFAKRNPEIVKQIVAAIDRAIDFIRTNESEAKGLLPKYTPIDSALAQKSRLYDWWKLSEVDTIVHQRFADILYDAKILSAPIVFTNMLWKP
jgi:NitT/TauT family transport system substrate-binding protein